MVHPSLFRYWRELYTAWVADYRRYARLRGFESFNDWPYHRRGFIECWAEPGFHRFWQTWNPGIAWFTYRLFLLMGGRKRWILPTLLTFIVNGFVHTLVVVPFAGHWSNVLIITFGCFGLLTILSRYASLWLRQETWPVVVNIVVNIALVVGSFSIGFRLNDWLST